MELITNYNDALKKLYAHVGFIENWVVCPIDDCTGNFWHNDDDQVFYADSEYELNNEVDNYYEDDIYKQKRYSKWVYEGKELTMIMCDPHVDGVKWFRVFDNKKKR